MKFYLKKESKFIIFILICFIMMTFCNANLDESNNGQDNSGENETNNNSDYTYNIVDTNISLFYNNDSKMSEPAEGESFYGQDASYTGNLPSYTDNGDGTITDNITGLMWEQDMGDKITYDEASNKAGASTLGGPQ